MSQIFIANDYGQRGPFSEEDVFELLERDEISWDDLAWRDGMEGWEPLREVLGEDRATETQIGSDGPREPVFHHVATGKFVLMTLLTLGLYELYWFYKGWKFIKAEEQSRIWPFWRAFFAPLWFYPFSQRVFGREGRPRKSQAALLAIAYLILSSLWRLPDPYWLISYGSLVIMLPLVASVNRQNREIGVRGPAYRRFGALHGFAALAGIPLLLLTIGSGAGLFPGTSVVEGARVPGFHRDFLRDAEILLPGESIVYFYSAGFLDYKADGNFFTENRVVSYWQEDGDVWIEEAVWGEIESVSPEFAATPLDDTVLTITRFNGSRFFLWVSAEGGGDRRFIDTLLDYWERGKEDG